MSSTSWREGHPFKTAASSDGTTYYRPTWGSEVIFAAGSLQAPGYEDILFSVELDLPVSATLSLSKDTVRAAAKRLRWEHPTVAASLVWPPADGASGGPYWVYTCPSEQQLERWLDETVFDQSEILAASGSLSEAVQTLREGLGRQDAPKSSSYHFQLHFIGSAEGSKSAVLLRCTHVLFDGEGTLNAVDGLLRALASYNGHEEFPWGTEQARLSPAVPDVAKLPPTQPVERDEDMLAKIRAAASLSPSSVGLIVADSHKPSFSTSNLLTVIPSPIPEQLKTAARAHNVGLYATLLAANYAALISLTDLEKADKEALHGALVPIASNLRTRNLAASAEVSKLITSALGSYAIIARDLSRLVKSTAETDRVEIATEQLWVLAGELQGQLDEQRRPQDTAYRWAPLAIQDIVALWFGQPRAEQPLRHVNVISLGNLSSNVSSLYPTSGNDSISVTHPILTLVRYALSPLAYASLLHIYGWGDDELWLSASWCTDSIVGGGKGVPEYVGVFVEILKRLACQAIAEEVET